MRNIERIALLFNNDAPHSEVMAIHPNPHFLHKLLEPVYMCLERGIAPIEITYSDIFRAQTELFNRFDMEIPPDLEDFVTMEMAWLQAEEAPINRCQYLVAHSPKTEVELLAFLEDYTADNPLPGSLTVNMIAAPMFMMMQHPLKNEVNNPEDIDLLVAIGTGQAFDGVAILLQMDSPEPLLNMALDIAQNLSAYLKENA